jgi:hypothetical protein
VTVKPAPIRGEVPPDYRGPVYYRARIDSYEGFKRGVHEFIKFEQKGLGQDLASADPIQAAHRVAPQLFDEKGELLPKWTVPLKARAASDAPKNWPEWASGSYTVVSQRVRDAIEEFEPGKHVFIPIDVANKDGSARRVYAFYQISSETRPSLALAANGIEHSLGPSGDPLFEKPEWLKSDRFAYLNSQVVRDSAVDFDPRTGLVLSGELVEKLGDVFPKGLVLVPMGLADEKIGGRG